MRNYIFLILIISLIVYTSCDSELDNYNEPYTVWKGAILYQGDTIRVAHDQVRIELRQPGFELNERSLNIPVTQNGEFNAVLFTGDYWINLKDGPYRPIIINESVLDTIKFTLVGDKSMNINVIPYYLIRNPQFSLGNGMVKATCSVEQIIKGENAREVEQVRLFLNTTRFVSNVGSYNLDARYYDEQELIPAKGDLSDLNDLSMSLILSNLDRTQNYLFARIGLQIKDTEDWIFSPVEKLTF